MKYSKVFRRTSFKMSKYNITGKEGILFKINEPMPGDRARVPDPLRDCD